ncbi:dehydrogenase of unknown specificity, short-chain alcohol dehydrogenase like [Spongiibacter sp. IMCC21906]|uniref:SDR family NAD(P)-dependent oxidoreductase n=1 Tax=Spongiibacter sp. IMCC21906 TaxID=1620392 RepID=UPI00062DE355|nr:SDR family NAD(P)-dependent oxidoreductase [Spongiibacter sp. IMCC21906]AKH67913.1 dehydrogenase of unknown specificity, short-chain alcohol dehydrogenase like [Spongiibacter sp. IMCC21906]
MKQVLEERIVVNRQLEDCFEYLRDFSTIEQWDPGVYRAEKRTPGAAQNGTEYVLTLKLPLGQRAAMRYVQQSTRENSEIILQGLGEDISALDSLRFDALGPSCTAIHYRAELKLLSLSAVTKLAIKPILKRVGKQAATGLYHALCNNNPPTPRTFTERLSDRLIAPKALSFGKRGYLNMPNKAHSHRMDGKVVLITGPTAGLGLAAACELSRLGATLVLLGRDQEKLHSAKQKICAFSGGSPSSITIFHADFSELQETAKAAEYIAERHHHIDVVINNAGAILPERQENRDGLEHTIAVNLLSPLLLIDLLQTRLTSKSRVINVVSGGLYLQGLDVNDIQFSNRPFSGTKAYASAKRALLTMTELLSKTREFHLFAMHPGWAATPGVAKSLPGFQKRMQNQLRDARMGADTMIWLASNPALNSTASGQFWFDRRPQISDILPGTAVNSADQQRLAHWIDNILSHYRKNN